ncbi:MAG: hypothetical protein E7559_05360 [Ruminococcaceae bacterium]|nr:hypothetical protein [Oscillospiraceae bacterium]
MIHAIDRRRFLAAFAVTAVVLMTVMGIFSIGEMSREKVQPTVEPMLTFQPPEWAADGRAAQCGHQLVRDLFPLASLAADTYLLICTALAGEL